MSNDNNAQQLDDPLQSTQLHSAIQDSTTPAPKKSLKVPIAIFLVLIILIATMGGAWILMANDQKDPERTLNSFVDAYNSGNTKNLLDLTDAHFLPPSEFSDTVNGWDNDDSFHNNNLKIISIETRYQADMTLDENVELEDNIAALENGFNIIIEDYAKVNYNLRIEFGNESDIDSSDMLAMKVEGKWYLAIITGLGGETSSFIPTPVTSLMFDVISSYSVKITFGTFSTVPSPMDIKITLTNVNDYSNIYEIILSKTLDAGTVSMNVTDVATVTYTDSSYQENEVNAGDYITILGIKSGSTYAVSIYHYKSNKLCKLTGTSNFTTPIANEKSILIELKTSDAPNTCANFEKYVNDGFYDGLIFHRVVDSFMIQGGGFYPDLTPLNTTYPPINLEISPNLSHTDGAIAMARTNDPNSATSQFYICDGAQPLLDDNYAVFGQVISGMEYVRAISAVQVTFEDGMYNVPVNDVVILSARLSTSSGKTYVTFVVDF